MRTFEHRDRAHSNSALAGLDSTFDSDVQATFYSTSTGSNMVAPLSESVLVSDQMIRQMPPNQFEEPVSPPPARMDAFTVVWGVNVEARWIDEEVGYGIYALTDIPPHTDVTTYDGPRMNPATGKVCFEHPHSLSVEQSFPTQWKRSGKWGLYERSHCVLVKRLARCNTCIDGSFSSQPFLFAEPFHGGIGFGALLNGGTGSGADATHNVILDWRRDYSLPEDRDGVLDQVHTLKCCHSASVRVQLT